MLCTTRQQNADAQYADCKAAGANNLALLSSMHPSNPQNLMSVKCGHCLLSNAMDVPARCYDKDANIMMRVIDCSRVAMAG